MRRQAFLRTLLLLGVVATTIVTTSAGSGDPTLVAAYAFEETGGSIAADASGSGNTGTISGATSTAAGRFGRGLLFDGVDDIVSIADSSSLDLTSALTLEAWVDPQGGGWRTVMLKERPGGLAYALYSSTDNDRPSAEIRTSATTETRGPAALPSSTWSHVATTYDGATMRLYVNGAQVSSQPASGAIEVGGGTLRIGGNTIWGEYFRGALDEVRIYRRALTAAEIQADMIAPVVGQATDTQPPTAPGSLTAGVTGDDVQLAWSASSDDTGVASYRLYRSATPGFTVDGSTLLTTVAHTSSSYLDPDRPAGTWHYRVVAVDAAGNASSPSAQASAAIGPDSEPPSAPGSPTAIVSGRDVQLAWSAASDNLGVTAYRVWESKTPGFAPGGNTSTLIATLGGGVTSYVHANRPIGTTNYRIVAVDAAGNASVSSAEVAATVPGTDAFAPTAPGNLTATLVGDVVELAWLPSTDDVGVKTYRVYRSTTPGFWPYTTGNWIGQVGGGTTSYADDVNVASGTFYYKVIAHDELFNFSPQSNEVAATLGADTTPPTVSIDGACDGAVAHSEYFYVTVPVSDDRGAVDLRVLVDGVPIWVSGAYPVSGSGRFEWNTRNNIANGLHVMRAVATDGAGNTTTSAPCTWLIHNKVLTVPISSPLDGATVRGVVPLDADPRADGLASSTNVTGVAFTVNGLALGWAQWPNGFVLPWDTRALPNGVYTIQARLHYLDYSNPQATSTIQVTVDNTVPQPTGLSATVDSDDVQLTWDAAPAGAGVQRFQIHRSATAGFTPGPANLVTPVGAATTSYTDANRPPGTWHYRLLAIGANDAASQPSPEVAATVDPDTTPPTVSFNHPCDGSVAISNLFRVSLSIFDDRSGGSVKVELGPTTLYAYPQPWLNSADVWFDWWTGAQTDGLHVLTATSSDAAGNQTVVSCTWLVDNPNYTVRFVSPADGATATGTTTLATEVLVDGTPTSSANLAYSVDGVEVNRPPTGTADRPFAWDTRTVANGAHALKASVYHANGGTVAATTTISVTVDNPPPPAPTGLTATVVTGDDVRLLWTAAPAGAGVTGYRVHRSTTPAFTPSEANRIASPAAATYDDLNRPSGTYYYRVVAAAGSSLSTPSAEVSATVANGLVAAYGFEAASGTTVADSSGRGNTGTISGAVSSAAGKFGRALSFDGVNDVVNVPDSSSLDLSAGMTLEAWVRPEGTNWRTVLLKERPSGLAYALYASTDTNRPSAELRTSVVFESRGPAVLPSVTWSHLAATFDGATLRLYVNGVQVSSVPRSGTQTIEVGTGAVRIGGNTIWGEYFRGLIDEVRIYNRALSAAEIAVDRDTPVGAP